MAGFNSNENQLRWKQIENALNHTVAHVFARNVFEALSSLQEAEIVLRAIQREIEIQNIRGDNNAI